MNLRVSVKITNFELVSTGKKSVVRIRIQFILTSEIIRSTKINFSQIPSFPFGPNAVFR